MQSFNISPKVAVGVPDSSQCGLMTAQVADWQPSIMGDLDLMLREVQDYTIHGTSASFNTNNKSVTYFTGQLGIRI